MKHSALVDALGRIVVPKHVRKEMEVKPGDELSFLIYTSSLVISKERGCYTRKLDSLGRITLPKETLKNLRINCGKRIEFEYTQGDLVIREQED